MIITFKYTNDIEVYWWHEDSYFYIYKMYYLIYIYSQQ